MRFQRRERYNMPPIPVAAEDSMPPQKRQRENYSILDIFAESSESDNDEYSERIVLL